VHRKSLDINSIAFTRSACAWIRTRSSTARTPASRRLVLPTFSCRPDSKVLKTKAVNYDVMRTWLDTLGGATSVEAAVAQAACVQTLLNQVVGLEALESQVARASSMRT
jgi:hypothetical protein